jgi:hypothetical protein
MLHSVCLQKQPESSHSKACNTISTIPHVWWDGGWSSMMVHHEYTLYYLANMNLLDVSKVFSVIQSRTTVVKYVIPWSIQHKVFIYIIYVLFIIYMLYISIYTYLYILYIKYIYYLYIIYIINNIYILEWYSKYLITCMDGLATNLSRC